MRRLFSFLIIITLLFSFPPWYAYSADPGTGSGNGSDQTSNATMPLDLSTVVLTDVNPCAQTPKPAYCIGGGIGGVVAIAVEFFFVIAVIISLGFIIYGGIRWITSGGDKQAVATARSTLIAAIVGLLIVFFSYLILNFVLTFLTGSDITKIQFNPLISK